jgi:hypothetical protein
MVVVVIDPILVEGRRPGRLNPPDEAFLRKGPKGVVYRLSRNGTDLGTSLFGDSVCRRVRSFRDRSQHSQSLCCDLDAMFAEDAGWVFDHSRMVMLIMESVKYWTHNRYTLAGF